MKTIVFIETTKSGSSREAIKAAERLGYYTVLYTGRESFLEKRAEFPDVHLMRLANLDDMDGLKKEIKRLLLKGLELCSIISFVDSYCHTACLLAEQFGVNRFSTNAIRTIQNKILSREILEKSPYTPFFRVLTKGSFRSFKVEDIENKFPLILKSPKSTGSKDVMKVNSPKQLQKSFQEIINKYPEEPVLLEEYLQDTQYLVEAVVYENDVHIVAIFEQEIDHQQRFIVTGYNLLINPPREFSRTLKEAVENIVKIHGLKSGPCHLEMRKSKNEWKLIEINSRISGGGMNQMIEKGYGINLVEETLKIALGQKPNLQPKYKKHTFCQYVTVSEKGILKKVTGKNRATRSRGVEKVYVKPKKGTLLIPPLSMGHRYAYVIATGRTEEEAKKFAKTAAAEIQFWTEKDDKLYSLPTNSVMPLEEEYAHHNSQPDSNDK